MGMSLPYIYYILRDIGVNYKNRILVSSDIETFSLTDSIELGPIVSAYDFSIWIFLVSGLLYMLATASKVSVSNLISYLTGLESLRKASSERAAILAGSNGHPVTC